MKAVKTEREVVIKTKYLIYIGSKDTMELVAARGVKGLNRKTHQWQIIDKSAKYKVIRQGGILYALKSDKNLKVIAEQKNLIL